MKIHVLLFFFICITLTLSTCQREELVSPGADSNAPMPPTGLRVEEARDGYVFVGWLKNTETDLRYYIVYRGESSVTASFAAVDTTTNNYFIDLQRSYDTTYYYYVAAIDRSGNISAPSDTVSALTPNLNDPDPPTDLSVHGHNNNGMRFIRAEWNVVVDGDIEGYSVHRALTPGDVFRPESKIAFTNSTYFDDSAATSLRVKYFYGIITTDRGKKQSAPSLTASDFISDPPMLFLPSANSQVRNYPVFSWRIVPEAVQYRVSISTSPVEGELWSEIVDQSGSDTLYAAYGSFALDYGRTYYWRVSTLSKQNGVPNATSEVRMFQFVR